MDCDPFEAARLQAVVEREGSREAAGTPAQEEEAR
jgi:hypothetical protein